MNKKDEALRDVNQAVSLNPQWDRSYSRQASVLFSLRKWTDTIDACKKGMRFLPDSFPRPADQPEQRRLEATAGVCRREKAPSTYFLLLSSLARH